MFGMPKRVWALCCVLLVSTGVFTNVEIFLARDNVPAPSYCFFIENLLCTVRDEIAACMEKAYERISLSEAANLLYLPSIDAAKIFATKRNWTLGRDNFYYFSVEEKKSDEKLPSLELSEQFIEYARELEMIV
ncbi:hypothetical protein B566_EDAN011993 [Ephemera danica]|nr:hypothetical protein B566_EDAN011993 [Ephemera danica]